MNQCEIVKLLDQKPPLTDMKAAWCNTHMRREIECLAEELRDTKLQLQEYKDHEKECKADHEALERLSGGLFKRLPDKCPQAVLSAVDTALNRIDFLDLQIGELKNALVDLLRHSRSCDCDCCYDGPDRYRDAAKKVAGIE